MEPIPEEDSAMRKTNCAFIGCGSIANAHCDSLIRLWHAGYRDFDISALCDTVVERADNLADKFKEILGHKPRVYGDAEVMLGSEKELDSAAVFTPPFQPPCVGCHGHGSGRECDDRKAHGSYAQGGSHDDGQGE